MEFILFILIAATFWYSYETRNKLFRVANAVDQELEAMSKRILELDNKVSDLQNDILTAKKLIRNKIK